jgi:hypothetical protein
MSQTLPALVTDHSTACPPGQQLNLLRALFAAFEWMSRKAEQRMSAMQAMSEPGQSAPAAMAQQRSQQASPQAAMNTAAVIPTVVAFAPLRPLARGLRNSKGDFCFKQGS